MEDHYSADKHSDTRDKQISSTNRDEVEHFENVEEILGKMHELGGYLTY